MAVVDNIRHSYPSHRDFIEGGCLRVKVGGSKNSLWNILIEIM